MQHVVRRFGFRISRGWIVLLVIIGAMVGLGFWIGPFRPLPADLKLLALGGDGRFREAVQIPRAWADTMPPQPDARARFPLVLAVYNNGFREATPHRLVLSVPARFRLSNSAGQEFPSRIIVGNPLTQYTFTIEPGTVSPRSLPRVLSSLDTLWLEPVLPGYYCNAFSDSVPEFVPAPAQNAASLSRVRVFYSFDARSRDRQTGLLDVQLDPSLLERAPTPAPPDNPATVVEPEAPRPAVGPLRRIGTRTTWCGDPGGALQISDVLWETATGGRLFVVSYGGAARKYLYDLDRDSIIELEIWDPDSDGRFEASRPTHMYIPEFLMPARPPVRVAVSTPTDSIAGDSLNVGAPAGAAAPAPGATPTAPSTMDYSPELFYRADDGPLRFWRALQGSRGQVPADSQRVNPPAAPTGRVAAPPRDSVRRDTTRIDTLRISEPSHNR
jgi:hypothetical protein